MLKEPRAGRVKTRLGRDIGMVPAAWWFRHQVKSLLRRVQDRRWKVILAVSPDNLALNRRIWPSPLARIQQGRGDLGLRMARAMRHVPSAAVCVIGGDIPGLGRAHLARAFRALGDHDAVFGPATDGGYWLIGMRRGAMARDDMFDGVRWSTSYALADSLACMSGWRVALADRLQDVDNAADLRALSEPERAC